jgi:DNA modification methylase
MAIRDPAGIDRYLRDFTLGDRRTVVDGNRFINEFWTSGQRQAARIQEISYRACFKPQLPAFFIDLLTDPDDLVYDPFSGRGTTVIEAGLLGRRFIANDSNPLSRILSGPRFTPPSLSELEERLGSIPLDEGHGPDIDLTMFYHERTLSEICSLREYLKGRAEEGKEDWIDRWIRMVATNRLTGHSKGFFSVYTLPPNQALSPQSQLKINLRKNQIPGYRDVKALILKKSRSLLKEMDGASLKKLRSAGRSGVFLTKDTRDTPEIASGSVSLIVTSPPFLNIVQYDADNWLRCWFNHIDAEAISRTITQCASVDEWSSFTAGCFEEFDRVVEDGGFVAFEVGEVRKGTINLDEVVVPIGMDAGFDPLGVVVNSQEFTKTANIWGVNNMDKGTNTNRIALFIKR